MYNRKFIFLSLAWAFFITFACYGFLSKVFNTAYEIQYIGCALVFLCLFAAFYFSFMKVTTTGIFTPGSEKFQSDTWYWPYDPNELTNDLILNEDRDKKNIVDDDLFADNEILSQRAKDNVIGALKESANHKGIQDYTDLLIKDKEWDEKTAAEIAELKQKRLDELMTDEFQEMTDDRYLKATEFVSKRLLQDEYNSPYNLLPMDLWYRPPDGAEDIFSTQPCMCPAELKLNSQIQYSEYKN